jgi:hypothetical protein
MEIMNKLLETLKVTSKTNDKIQLLKNNKDMPYLKEFFKLARDPNINFWIKKIPKYQTTLHKTTLPEVFKLLQQFSERKITGNNAKDALAIALGGLDNNEDKVIIRIIKKDPDCNIGIATINKIWPDLIKVWPYQRCSAHNNKNLEKIQYPAIAERKADGLFINTLVDPNKKTVKHLTREGNELHLHGKLTDEFLQMCPNNLLVYINQLHILNKGFVVLGEGVVLKTLDNSEIYPRKTGNGIINRAMHKTLTEKQAEHIRIVAWTIIPYKNWKNGLCEIPYQKRAKILRYLTRFTLFPLKKIEIIERKYVNNLNEIYKYFKIMKDRGEEGLVVKNQNAIWKHRGQTPSPDEVKIKEAKECELICLITFPHKKNRDWIGGLALESSCGRVKVNVGSGLTKEDRNKRPEEFIGRIITVHFESLISSKNKNTFSLFQPRFVEIRFDKSEADNLSYIRNL